MDYVQHGILRKIKKIEQKTGAQKASTLCSLYRYLLEYELYLFFACLWSKNEEKLPREQKSRLLVDLKKPMLGKLLNAIGLLGEGDNRFYADAPGTSDNRKQIRNCMERFIQIRNRYFGHGILVPGLQETTYGEICKDLKKIYEELCSLEIPLLSRNCKFYYRENPNGNEVVVFDNDDYNFRSMEESVLRESGLEDSELCYLVGTEMYRLTPFLSVRGTDEILSDSYEFYCYTSYSLKNNGFEYCKISSFTEDSFYSKIYPGFFQSFQEESQYTICKANGIICNKFENNYDYFISIDPITNYVKEIWDFICKSRSNTCLTISGEGGIGKTAMVQYICTRYLFEPLQNRTFVNYVIFCSAKDRELKPSSDMMGRIQKINGEGMIRQYEDLLQVIGQVFDLNLDADIPEQAVEIEQALISKKGVLLIIDDFETLPDSEKRKIVSLISHLQVDAHKVLITTRSQYMVGEEYCIRSLEKNQTFSFMRECFRQAANSLQDDALLNRFQTFIEDPENGERVFQLTRGLPLLALQLGKLLQLTDFEPLDVPEKWNDDVEEFLLGRLYTYFSTKTSKLLFILISQYYKCGCTEINKRDLSCFYDLYCAYFLEKNVDFELDLKELEKLKIICIETDLIRISNHISNKVLETCKNNILQEYGQKVRVFDDRLIKIVCDEGMEKGILQYSRREDGCSGFAFVKIFALENALSFTNEDRFQIISGYVEQTIRSGKETILPDGQPSQNGFSDREFLHDLYLRSQEYFIMEDRFNEFYGDLCLQHQYILPELKGWLDRNQEGGSPSLLLATVNEELNAILDDVDTYIGERRDKQVPHGYLVQRAQDISRRIAVLCKIRIHELNEQDLSGLEAQVDDIRLLIEEISVTKEFNMMENEECKQFMQQENS